LIMAHLKFYKAIFLINVDFGTSKK
jgi:hypothetical protein